MSPHRCRYHLDLVGFAGYGYECLVCGLRYDRADVEDWAAEDQATPDTPNRCECPRCTC